MDAMPSSALELPSDLAFEILLRLPVKALFRFKSVCKSWRSLIDSPAFISCHLNRSLSGGGDGTRSLILEYSCPFTEEYRVSLLSGQALELDTPVEVPPHLIWTAGGMVGCCNGVVCFSDGGRYTLWNPATREYRILPESLVFLSSPEIYNFYEGFGYDSAVDDYKVVRIAGDLLADKNCIRVEVFALSEGSWREIPAALAEFQVCSDTCVSLGGFLYWALGHSSDDYCILSFDLRDEVFRRVCYPDRSLIGNKKLQTLASSGESLCLIVFNYTVNDTVLDLWVMEGGPGKESWTKRLSIGAMVGINEPLGFDLNGGILLEKSDGMLAIYEAGKESVRDLPAEGVRCFVGCHFYSESLVRVLR